MAAEGRLNRLVRVARRARDDLGRLGLEWALIGGLAVAVRAEPRFTRDVDLAVAVADDRQAEGLIFQLQGSGYQIITCLEHEVTGRLATMRLRPPVENTPAVILDLLFASSGIEREVVDNATPVEIFADIVLPVASIGDLIALKVVVGVGVVGVDPEGTAIARLRLLRPPLIRQASWVMSIRLTSGSNSGYCLPAG